MSVRVSKGGKKNAARRWAALFCAPALVLVADPAHATDAGTHIDNIATLHYTVSGTPQAVQSNVASIVVAERLDVTLVRTGTGPVPHDPKATLTATLTNTGSGHEAFAVAVTLGGTAVPGATVAIDVDGNGQYDPAHDTLLTNGQTPMLAPGASVGLIVMADTGAASATSLSVGAKATTASGTPGTVATGAGDGGGDAVVGPTGAAANVTVAVADAAAAPTLAKSQAIRAPDGSDKPVSGAVVTYTLDAVFPSATAGVRIGDPVPAGTRYVPGSLTLDGAALTDAADTDAGQADGTTVAVTLGAVSTPTTHRVQFQVQIQ